MGCVWGWVIPQRAEDHGRVLWRREQTNFKSERMREAMACRNTTSSVYVSVCASTLLCVRVCFCLCVCVRVCVISSVGVCLCACVFLPLCERMCVIVSLCMCVCVCVCVWTHFLFIFFPVCWAERLVGLTMRSVVVWAGIYKYNPGLMYSMSRLSPEV